MQKLSTRAQRQNLGKASRVTLGAYGRMVEAGGLWGEMKLSRD